jgi:hypothetical protein
MKLHNVLVTEESLNEFRFLDTKKSKEWSKQIKSNIVGIVKSS